MWLFLLSRFQQREIPSCLLDAYDVMTSFETWYLQVVNSYWLYICYELQCYVATYVINIFPMWISVLEQNWPFGLFMFSPNKTGLLLLVSGFRVTASPTFKWLSKRNFTYFKAYVLVALLNRLRLISVLSPNVLFLKPHTRNSMLDWRDCFS